MRAVVANQLQSTPWVPAYHDELNYLPPRPPQPPGDQTRRMLVISRGTLAATAVAG